MTCETIKQGDQFVWLARPSALDAGDPIDGSWSCQVAVYATDGSQVLAPAAVTAKHTHTDGEEYFLVVITKVQTAAMSVGTHYLVIEITNDISTPPYNKESEVAFNVAAQRIT